MQQMNADVLHGLPSSLVSEIESIELVEIGTHLTYRCYTNRPLKPGQKVVETWYLKSINKPSQLAGLRFETSINRAVYAAQPKGIELANVIWSSASGEQILLSKVTGKSATRIEVVNHVDTLLTGLIQVHQQPATELMLPTWQLENLSNDITSLRAEQSELDDCLLEDIVLQLERLTSFELNKDPVVGLVHGDLNAGNLLFDNNKHQWGVLDWECAQCTDVRWDLASIAVEYALSDDDSLMLFHKYAKLINVNVDQFSSCRQSWITFYRLTCLIWSIKNNYPVTRYLQR